MNDEAPMPDESTGRLGWVGGLPRWARFGGAALALVSAALAVVWIERESIVRGVADDQLEQLGLKADYEVEALGVTRQVLRHVRLGDPAAPDLVADRIVIDSRPGLGGLGFERVRIEGLRLFGRQDDTGRISFGSLDPLIYTDSDAPFELPNMALELDDARARIETDYGVLGLKASGAGHLRDGFEGQLALVGDGLAAGGCALGEASLFGAVRIVARKPVFDGPLRFDTLDCGDLGFTAAKGAVGVRIEAASDLASLTGTLTPRLEGLDSAYADARATDGSIDFAWRDGALNGSAALGLRELATDDGEAGFDRLAMQADFSASALDSGRPRWSLDAGLNGTGLDVSPAFWRQASDWAGGVRDTPVGPLARQLLLAAQQGVPGGRLMAQIEAGSEGDEGGIAYTLGDMRLVGRPSGRRGAFTVDGGDLRIAGTSDGPPELSGRIATRGPGFPALTADFAPTRDGGTRVSAKLATYSAPGADLAVPEFTALLASNGNIRFSGRASLSGPLAGGRIDGLAMPFDGRWSSAGGLSLIDDCVPVALKGLRLANLTAGAQRFRLCPGGGGPLVRQAGDGWQIAARMPQPRFKGALGGTPLDVQAESIEMGASGALVARAMTVLIGDRVSGTHIEAGTFTLAAGETLGGRFEAADAYIGSIPLLMFRGRGAWEYRDSELSLAAEEWFLRDRQVPARFQPLITHDATLRLSDGVITAAGRLREPQSDRQIVRVDIAHQLANGTGHADLIVEPVRFDDTLQPEEVTRLALGVVANVQGSMEGRGRIDWNPDGVTSSGRFRTESMDLAAAFGPVTGLAGEIVFDDLLAMTTPPGQRVTMQEINPGVPVYDGEVRYQLLPDFVMRLEHGQWPFAGGQLIMEPARLALAEDKPRNLSFQLVGVDAAKFLARFDYDDIYASGVFDGRLPMVFDQDGGRIVDGRIEARDGGGNLAYVGQLTYEDLGTFGNFAFNALKSMDYRNLSIEMNGEIDGEVLTEVRFGGVTQGEGASRNIITRQFDKIPIQFNVNIRAPFMELLNRTRSLYDTSYLPDPTVLGILPGGAVIEGRETPEPTPRPESETPPEPARKEEDSP